MHHFVTRAHFCYKMVHCGIFAWCIVGLCNRYIHWHTYASQLVFISVLICIAPQYIVGILRNSIWATKRIRHFNDRRTVLEIWLTKLPASETVASWWPGCKPIPGGTDKYTHMPMSVKETTGIWWAKQLNVISYMPQNKHMTIFLFCCVLLRLWYCSRWHVVQGYFTDTGVVVWLSRDSEWTLRNTVTKPQSVKVKGGNVVLNLFTCKGRVVLKILQIAQKYLADIRIANRKWQEYLITKADIHCGVVYNHVYIYIYIYIYIYYIYI